MSVAAVWVIRVLAGVAVLSALIAITRRNPVYSAVFLGLNFLALGGVFAVYASPFIGAIQVIVYTGAILVLFIIAIMVLNLRDEELGPPKRTIVKFLAVMAAAGLFLLIVSFVEMKKSISGGIYTAYDIGRILTEKHVVAFEVLSVLLVFALVGAGILAKKKLEV